MTFQYESVKSYKKGYRHYRKIYDCGRTHFRTFYNEYCGRVDLRNHFAGVSVDGRVASEVIQ